MRNGSLRILVLGSAAGGGFPQWNCGCPNCRLAWRGDPRVERRTQSSLAVSVDGERWLLLNASPDLREQIAQSPELQPRGAGRHSPIEAVFLTNGDVDHVAGLLTLRERQPLVVHGGARVLAELGRNSIFGVLDRSVTRFETAEPDEVVETSVGVSVTAFVVPGKTPLYLEDENLLIGVETGDTIGLDISGGGQRFFYIPGCAAVTPRLLDRLAGADLLFFDGTCFTNEEMVRLGLSEKTAARMGHLAMSGPAGSMAALAGADVRRKIFVHINNTNPVLVDGAPERRAVEAQGWEIGRDGLRITLEGER